jgi:serine/threonine protein kinase
MNDLTLEQPRRCPVCERLVLGARCLLDDAVTVPVQEGDAVDPLVGTDLVEGFRAVRRVPSGRGGATYEVVQEGSGRRGRLRLLDLTEAESFGVAERFAKIYSSLFSAQLPGAPAVVRYGRVAEGHMYVLTGAPEGEDLDTLLQRRWPLSPSRSVAIASCLVDTLAGLHALGVVHGDVSPSRVWIKASEDGVDEVSLTDAGLFEVMAARGHVPPPAEGGTVISDPRTMSPEVAAGYSADARADLYSLGILLGMLATGVEPFEYANRGELLRRHLREPYPAASLGGLPEDLKRIVVRLTEKSPNARFQTAEELKRALQNTRELIDMIGHDTDPDLSALASSAGVSTARWGEMITIGEESDADGPAPVLASPSVLLREPVAPASKGRGSGRRSSALSVLAVSLIFLIVAGLVALRFLTSVEGRRPETNEALASLQQQPAARGEGEPARAAGKVKATSALVTVDREQAPAVSAPTPPSPRASTPAAASAPTASTPAVPASDTVAVGSTAVQLVDATTRPGQPIAIEVRSTPSGAFVMRDGFKIGQTPLTISLQSRRPFLVSLEKPGYLSYAVEVVPELKSSYDVRLAVAPAAPRPVVKAEPKPAATARPVKPSAPPKPAARDEKGKKAEPATGYDLF